jgi:hypothetical protein
MQPHGHAPRIAILQHAFERKGAAASNDGRLNLALSLPAFQAAMRLEDLAE